MKTIYKYYKERLIEISGKNRSLYSKKISKKYSYDIGKLLRTTRKFFPIFSHLFGRVKNLVFR